MKDRNSMAATTKVLSQLWFHWGQEQDCDKRKGKTKQRRKRRKAGRREESGIIRGESKGNWWWRALDKAGILPNSCLAPGSQTVKKYYQCPWGSLHVFCGCWQKCPVTPSMATHLERQEIPVLQTDMIFHLGFSKYGKNWKAFCLRTLFSKKRGVGSGKIAWKFPGNLWNRFSQGKKIQEYVHLSSNVLLWYF